jgi:hypothetical protein
VDLQNSPGNQFGPTFAETEHADAGPTCSTNSMNKAQKERMVFIQHEDAFIYFLTLDPHVGNLTSKFKESAIFIRKLSDQGAFTMD